MLTNLFLLCGAMLAVSSGPPCEVFFQAHRGGGNEMPENTLAAFKRAFEIPGAVPEVDLRTTQDGVIVCMHDATAARTSNAQTPWREKAISEIPYEIVRTWDVGSHFDAAWAGECPPSLEMVFDLMKEKPGSQIYLDLKEVDLEALLKLIQKAGLEERVIFVHGDPAMCKKLHALYPGARTMTWLSGMPLQIREKYAALKKANFEGISQLQFHLRVRRAKAGEPIRYIFSESFIESVVQETQAAGVDLQLRPFAFDAESLKRLIQLGVRWYVSDEPAAFAKVVAEACGAANQ